MKSIVIKKTLLVISLFCLAACFQIGKLGKNESLEKPRMIVQTENEPIEGGIEDNRWRTREVHFKEQVFAFFFLTANVGWVVEGGQLKKTNDAGKHWVRLSSLKMDGFVAKQILFIDEMKGWLVVTNNRQEALRPQSVSLILSTRDGGRTWEKSKIFSSAIIDEMKIDYVGDLWVRALEIYQPYKTGGENDARSKLICYRGFIARKKQPEAIWEDLSHEANDIIEVPGPRDCINESFADFNFAGPDSVLIMTGSGSVIEGSAGASIWRKTEFGIDTLSQQAQIRSFGLFMSDTFWLLSSSRGVEGTGTRFISKGPAGNFVKDFSGQYLVAMKPLSKGKLIAAGEKLIVDADNDIMDGTPLVIVSSDFGRTWHEIYESEESGAISALQVINESSVCAQKGVNDIIFLWHDLHDGRV